MLECILFSHIVEVGEIGTARDKSTAGAGEFMVLFLFCQLRSDIYFENCVVCDLLVVLI